MSQALCPMGHFNILCARFLISNRLGLCISFITRSAHQGHRETILTIKSSFFSSLVFLLSSFSSELTEVGCTVGEGRVGCSTLGGRGSTRERHSTEGGGSLKVAHTKLGRTSLGCCLGGHLVKKRRSERGKPVHFISASMLINHWILDTAHHLVLPVHF